MSTVISVEQICKSYRLGVIGSGTFGDDLKMWWAKVRGKPNPLLRIGEKDYGNGSEEEIWALRDISFNVEQGEVLGIIGRNGAGKSTLLKILSRVTAPTSGEIKVKGRIASLLEVGTGFHPDLTGRENIYLNGAILGMTKDEVRHKFDEIVDFSGVEQFIETPVKRYSSGMYVRLAFAVAAHLNPEILMVDEVLAVGDAEFQKKCLGKMGKVAEEGRTVFFVSHNLQAVQNLCRRAIVLKNGVSVFDGKCSDAVSFYLQSSLKSQTRVAWDLQNAPGNNQISLVGASIEAKPILQGKAGPFTTNDELEIQIDFVNHIPGDSNLGVTIHLIDERDIKVFVSGSGRTLTQKIGPGLYRATCQIPRDLLNQGTFTINRLLFIKDRGFSVFEYPNVLTFDVVMPGENQFGWMGKKEGVIRPALTWAIDPIEKKVSNPLL
jgi:lipopolysaccharide transport system ATP-binding protein